MQVKLGSGVLLPELFPPLIGARCNYFIYLFYIFCLKILSEGSLRAGKAWQWRIAAGVCPSLNRGLL